MKEKFDGLVKHLLDSNILLEEAVEVLERSMIHGALQLCKSNQSAAAKRLGIHRNTLQRKMIEYHIGGRARRKPAARASRTSRRKNGAA